MLIEVISVYCWRSTGMQSCKVISSKFDIRSTATRSCMASTASTTPVNEATIRNREDTMANTKCERRQKDSVI